MHTLNIVTISLDDHEGLRRTIASIDNQEFSSSWKIRHLLYFANPESNPGVTPIYSENFERVVMSEEDAGRYHAMNLALDAIKTGWVQFLNSGDVLKDSALFSATKILENSESDIVQFQTLLPDSRISPKRNFSTLEIMLARSMHAHPSLIISFDRMCNLRFDTKYLIAADYKFVLQALKRSQFQFESLVLAEFEGQGISTIKYLECIKEMEAIRLEMASNFICRCLLRIWNAKILLSYKVRR